jgi:hypothetical protein
MRLNCLGPLLAAIAVTLPIPVMAADTHIQATFTANYDRIRPEPHPGINFKNTLEVTLSGLNEVKEKNTRQAGNLSDNQKGLKILGQKSSDIGSSWTVAGPNRLERVVNSPQSTTTMTIEVSDKSCKLDVQFKLKPGFNEYMFKQIRNGQMGYFTEPKVTSTTCSIK